MSMPPGPHSSRLADAYAHCETLVREGDADRWLACLFAPADLRPHLYALYAFSLDVARVRDIVSDPMPREIRFQWWRDAIDGGARGDIAGHPVAAALLDTIDRFDLPRAALTNLVDARTFDLYDDPMPGIRQLEGYCGETSSALIRLATIVLSVGKDPGGADAAGHCGVAYGITGLLRALPWHAARGQIFLPEDMLKKHGASREDLISGRPSDGLRATIGELIDIARAHLAAGTGKLNEVDAGARAAFLPVSLVEPYLRKMAKRGFDPFRTPAMLPQWRRQWILWRAASSLG